MKIKLPQAVNNIILKLNEHGHEAFAVGGCVRDSLLGREPADWDITTDASPLEVKAIFPRTFDTGIEHGTVTVLINHVGYEVTTYRVDGDYLDSRHPSEVTFTRNLSEDLKRRDFTINAFAYNDSRGVVDEFHGIEDLQNGIIKCVGDPRERFKEDALRMLRAVRFAAQLGFEIEDETRNAIKELAPTIANISAERIRVEMLKLIESDNPRRMVDLYQLGLTKYFMPEFDAMMETAQNTPHHMYSVGEHTIVAMENVKADKVLRLAMLFHDFGKPSCEKVDENGVTHFKGHPEVSADMTSDVMRRLKFDNDTIKKVKRLVRYHDERPRLTPVKVRQKIVEIGEGAFPDLFDVKRADVLAQSNYERERKLEAIAKFEELYLQTIEEKNCINIKEMKINGKDLKNIGINEGPIVGKILKSLFAEVVEYPNRNEEEYLIRRAKEIYEENEKKK